MNHKAGLLAVLVVSAGLVVGASAFTTGSIDRASSVNVVTDDAGLIGLEDGTSGNIVQQNGTGALTIDFGRNGASGVNTAGHFELGNPADPLNRTAFNLTNNDGTTHDITVQYLGAGGTSDPDANIQFQIYDGAGSQVGTVSEESTSATVTNVGAGSTYYVVIVVDTHGLDSNADLSGTLNVTV